MEQLGGSPFAVPLEQAS